MDDNVILITTKQIETIEDRLAIAEHSTLMNMGTKGVVCVDKDHPEYSKFLKLAIDYAIAFGNTEEAERLKKENPS
ncbi:hypothetical protein [Bacteroides timonensis]|uniref:hypothetical protein n=1 Tax=Bacteroides timonensis TaxID=1470345 RepID=UPI0004B9384E|nr:hypothetical protein [Bacteroides timonensis]